MDQKQMMQIVEGYSRQSEAEFGEIRVKQVADQKTVYIEQFVEGGRSIIMTEYKVNGKSYWAGYSSRSQTVYVSLGY